MIWAAWILALAMLTVFFNDWLERERNPNRVLASQVGKDGSREVILRRNRYNHYVATGRMNGQRVEFMVDTGASDISVPAALAAELGLERGAPRTYQTANGKITAFRTVVPEVALGEIVVHDVAASINPGMNGNSVLLGMSFLKHLEFSQQGDTLILRQH